MAFSYEQEIFGFICSFFVLCMMVICGLEIRAWVRKQTVISGRQLVVRMLGGVLMLVLLLRVLYGIYWVDYRSVDADCFLRFWAGCVGLAYLCLIVASVDMWLTMRLRRASLRARKRIAERLEAISQAYGRPGTIVATETVGAESEPQSPVPSNQ